MKLKDYAFSFAEDFSGFARIGTASGEDRGWTGSGTLQWNTSRGRYAFSLDTYTQ